MHENNIIYKLKGWVKFTAQSSEHKHVSMLPLPTRKRKRDESEPSKSSASLKKIRIDFDSLEDCLSILYRNETLADLTIWVPKLGHGVQDQDIYALGLFDGKAPKRDERSASHFDHITDKDHKDHKEYEAFPVVKSMLAGASPYFHALFYGSAAEIKELGRKGAIWHLRDADATSFDVLLRLIHGKAIDVNLDLSQALRLYALADRYQFTSVTNCVAQRVPQWIQTVEPPFDEAVLLELLDMAKTAATFRTLDVAQYVGLHCNQILASTFYLWSEHARLKQTFAAQLTAEHLHAMLNGAHLVIGSRELAKQWLTHWASQDLERRVRNQAALESLLDTHGCCVTVEVHCVFCHNRVLDKCTACEVQSHDDAKHACTLTTGECQHAYHTECVEKWLRNGPRTTCPLDDSEWHGSLLLYRNLVES